MVELSPRHDVVWFSALTTFPRRKVRKLIHRLVIAITADAPLINVEVFV